MHKNQVCLFFFIKGCFLIHGCEINEAENYGDFMIYPQSHFEIWQEEYADRYPVEFDFFPRGRVAYRKSDNTYQILYDRCIGEQIEELVAMYDGKVTLGYDEHYQCYMCNQNYV